MKRSLQILCLGILWVSLSFYGCQKDPASETGGDLVLMRGKDLSSYAVIKADSITKTTNLVVKKPGNWKLFSGINDQSIDFSRPLITGESLGEYGINKNSFQIFCLEWEDGSRSALGMRKLPLEKQHNLRDLGGYKTTDGKTVKWGKIFRSGDFSDLHTADINYLVSTGINTLVDLRSSSEKSDSPNKIPSSLRTHNINIELGDLGLQEIIQLVMSGDENAVTDYFTNLNRELILDYQAQYKALFDLIESKENTPLVFHCTAGKDRAGLGAALFLMALGVDKQTVMEDYLLTNVCTGVSMDEIRALYGNYGVDETILECIYYAKSARIDYIGTAFATIEQHYGSVENFLRNQLEVDIEKLKSVYLY